VLRAPPSSKCTCGSTSSSTTSLRAANSATSGSGSSAAASGCRTSGSSGPPPGGSAYTRVVLSLRLTSLCFKSGIHVGHHRRQARMTAPPSSTLLGQRAVARADGDGLGGGDPAAELVDPAVRRPLKTVGYLVPQSLHACMTMLMGAGSL
jgi:hypothetical protein